MTSSNVLAEEASSARPRRTRGRRVWLILAGIAFLASAGLACEGWAVWQERSARRALDQDRLDEARRSVDRALYFHPARVSTNLLAARIARRRGAFPEAALHLDRCRQAGEMSEPALLEWLLLRCERGEVDELSARLLSLVDHDHPESPAILEALAGAYMRQTRYLEALRCLDRWLERTPDSIRALDWHGWVCNQLDHRAQAIDDYERILELQPQRSGVRFRLADILVESSRHDAAVSHLERLLEEEPANPAVMVALGRCRVAQCRVDEARALYDAALEVQPGHFEALLHRGQLELSECRFADAERWLRKALAKAPLDPAARYALFRCLRAQPGRESEAQQALARWKQDRMTRDRLTRLLRTELDLRPKDPEIARETGELFLQLGEDRRGLYWLNRSLVLDPRHAASHRALIAYYERTGDTARAAEQRKKLQLVEASK